MRRWKDALLWVTCGVGTVGILLLSDPFRRSTPCPSVRRVAGTAERACRRTEVDTSAPRPVARPATVGSSQGSKGLGADEGVSEAVDRERGAPVHDDGRASSPAPGLGSRSSASRADLRQVAAAAEAPCVARIEALLALADDPSPAVEEEKLLRQLVERPDDPAVLPAAVRALAATAGTLAPADERSVELEAFFLSTLDRLAHVPTAEASEAIGAALAHPAASVRTAAAAALGPVDTTDPRVMEILQGIAQADRSAAVRRAAWRTLNGS